MNVFQFLGKKTADQLLEQKQRASNRIPCRNYACVHAATGAVFSDCLVKDISETGARIILPRAIRLPKQVTLRLTGKATPMGASVVWQAGTKCGLKFNESSCV